MDPGGGTSAPARRWSAGDIAWSLVLVAALSLPARATATWMHPTYGASLDDVQGGIWLFKACAAMLALVALALPRLRLAPGNGGDTSATPPASDAGALRIVVGALLLIALVLRLYQLDTELWLDELLLRVRYAPIEIRQLLSTYDSQNHQPLYSILANLSFMAAGGTDWSVRLPAVLFGVASLGAMWWFGRRVTSKHEALLGVFLLTVSYHHVWFSQNARGYTTMMFLVVVATGLFRNLLEGSSHPRLYIWGYAICMALATYTHLTVALIAVGHALTVPLVTRWGSADSRARALWCGIALGLSALITLCLYAPMFPQVWSEVTRPTMEGVSVEWTGTGWMLTEGLRVLGEGVPGGAVTVLIALGVLGMGAASYWRQSRATALLMFLPVAVTFVAIVAARHNLWPRFFFFASGFIVLAALRGGFKIVHSVLRWQPERVAVLGASAVGLLSLATVPRAWQPKQQFQAALEFVEQERDPADEVVALEVAYHVYLMRGLAPSWRFTSSLTMLREAERSARRTWVVYTLPARLRAVTPQLFGHITSPQYQVIRVFPATVGGGEIHVLRHDSPYTP